MNQWGLTNKNEKDEERLYDARRKIVNKVKMRMERG